MSLFKIAADAEDDGGLLSDRIRNALTDEIASGALAAGSALEEQLLADRFGASRTPVREALRQLAVSGLVEVRGRRGVVVARLTPERIMDMFETSAEVEAMCVRLATYRMTPLERSQLIELHEGSRAMVEANDVDAYDAFNRQFHECIYRATHNSFMAEQAQDVRSVSAPSVARNCARAIASAGPARSTNPSCRRSPRATAKLRRVGCAPIC